MFICNMKQEKYFDIKSGHYKYRNLNEGEQATGSETQQETKEQTKESNSQQVQQGFKSPDTDSQIMSLNQQKQNIVNDYNLKIKTEKDNLLKAKQVIANSLDKYSNYTYNPTDVADEILNRENSISVLSKELADRVANIDSQIIQRKKALAAELVKESKVIPEKYKEYYLNESKLNNAKIYLDDILFNEDYDLVISSMTDFKRVFSNSNLLYGKDKQGYFVVCADMGDYNQLLSILRALGYDKSDVDCVVTPQVFDKLKLAIF